MTTGRALNTATKALLEVCSLRGVQADELLATAKINPALFERYNIRIPVDKKCVIWEEARSRLGDEHLGLRAAQIVPFGAYGVLDSLLFTSSTDSPDNIEEILTATPVKKALAAMFRKHLI